MKKLVLFFAVALMTAISANVFAQGTGITPEVGSVHNYAVNTGATSYSWTVTDQAAPGGTDLLAAGLIVSAPATNANNVDITWLNPDVANNQIYFVHVAVTDNGCTNSKVIAVQPENNFSLDIVNIDNSGIILAGDDSLDYSICAPEITVSSWNGTDAGAGSVTAANANDFNYDYGTVVFYYRITASGINEETTSWTPEFTIAQIAGTNATVTIDSIAGGTTGGTWETTTWATDGSTIAPTIPSGVGNDVLWVRITVENGDDSPADANENLSDNDFTLTLTGGSDENTNDAQSLGDIKTVQTQSARPTTGDIITTN